jgi:hypothetical protein
VSDVQQPSEQDERTTGEAATDSGPSPLPGQPSPGTRRRDGHRPSLFWPLVLIGGGALLLLSNLGYLPWQSWNILWRLWPLLLVALGADLLIGRRSLLRAIVSALVILALIGGAVAVALFAQNIPMVAEWAQPAEWSTDHVEFPRAGVERAEVNIDWTSVPGYLSALDDSQNLIEADVTYRGQLIFDVDLRRDMADVRLDSRFTFPWFAPAGVADRDDRLWDVRLSPEVPLDLTLDVGSGPCELDLTGLEISGLILDAGSGPIGLVLPSGGTFDAEIDAGSGPMEIILPPGVGARVELDSGSGPFNANGRFRLVRGSRSGDGAWETDDFPTARQTIAMVIDQGSGPITIR